MVRFSAPDEAAADRGDGGIAPVIPLFDGARADHGWHSSWTGELDEPDPEDDDDGFGADGVDDCAAIEREIAERNLTKRLRSRQLSVAEARVVVAERDLEPAEVEDVLARFQELGYLDDAGLAEQLTHAATSRKGQGRKAIAQTLAKRGIPRDVADTALMALPDDDAERALEFARGKARSMAGLDRETAVRRLTGQLARRGYPGGVAFSAAKQALDEEGASGGVRFR